MPLASYYRGNHNTLVKAKYVTEVLHHAMQINVHHTGIDATSIGAWSLFTGGAIALLQDHMDMINIRMIGRWHSGTMMRYLHVQAQPILGNYAARMFNEGNCSFLPDETIPIIDVYADDL
jgi:hypothetical protein